MKIIPKHLLHFCLALFCGLNANATSFNVTGKESLTEFSLLFSIFDATGTPLAGKTWNSATQKYQDDDTDKFIPLKYWHVEFAYNPTSSMINLKAWHLVDPHTHALDEGGHFEWAVGRPTATPIPGSGALKGSDAKTEKTEHPDSDGNHSDRYTASILYLVNKVDTFTRTPTDYLNLEIKGAHRGVSVPETSSTWFLALPGLLGLVILKRSLRGAEPRGGAGCEVDPLSVR
jgi:hypothetical protein